MNGNNRIEGGGGDDLINTAVGNDTLVFAAGFDNDMVSGFDANGAGGQDLLNVAGLGITAATFADDVTIAVQGIDTVVSFAGTTDSITLFGINGVGANTITIDDFRFV
ncbi:MAG: hypothetical protein KJZ80_02665 [Hyphomicrobiaceae bacterium]|nr:hypothetical protein [Hyphomicrobiaceae bacterium]